MVIRDRLIVGHAAFATKPSAEIPPNFSFHGAFAILQLVLDDKAQHVAFEEQLEFRLPWAYFQVRNTPPPTQNMTAVAIHPTDLR